MDESIFNLIACLIKDFLDFSENKRSENKRMNTVSEEYSDEMENMAKTILQANIDTNSIGFDNRMCLTSQNFNDIIGACKVEENLLLYRSVLCQLDMMIDIHDLIRELDFNSLENTFSIGTFEQLNSNSNVETTGILIIPKVPSPKQTFLVTKNSEPIDKEYKDSNYWYDNLNEHFNNIIYIKKTSLGEYTIKNVMIDFFAKMKEITLSLGLLRAVIRI